jgi:DNA-binding SARP family transcriptional activator/predicted ATPase
MSRLSLRLWGSPEVRFGERPLAFRTRKAFALLAYLAVAGGQQTREHLSVLFWPESDAALGRASLRNTLGYLHAALGAADPASRYLVVSREAIGFDPQVPHDSDLAALQGAMAALRAGDVGRDELIARLDAAATAYRGDFLAGFSLGDAPEFDDWATLQREIWHQRVAAIFDRLSALLADGGESARAIEAARRWVALDRLNEVAHRRLIALHLAAGDRAAALRAVESCRATLDAELGIAPEPETLALAERARAAANAPPVAAVAPVADTPLVALGAAPLVGRSAEFAALVAAFETARRGRAGVVTLEGEPGIGKSRLARDFLTRAAAQGAALLVGQGFETGGRLPYQPVIDALRRRNAATPFATLVAERWLAELSRLLPELREQAPALPPPSGDEAVAQTRLFEAVAELGRALAARGALVLHLDDLQWADAATLDLLAYLARRWSEEGVRALLLLGLRSEGLAHADGARPALGEWLVGFARTTSLTRLLLAPITADATAQLVAALAGVPSADSGGRTGNGGSSLADRPPSPAHGPSFTDWLFAETGGQPFYLLETLKALFARGAVAARRRPEGGWLFDFSAVAAAGGPGLVPPGVRELIWSQLQRLAPPAFALLVAGAVLGHGFDFPRLCQVAALDEDAGLLALDQALAARLLREAEARDGTYAFAHDRIRDVAYAEGGEARRRVFHRRALAALQEAGASPAELARHAGGAGLTIPALRFTIAAGDAAMRLFAVPDALAHYSSAREALAAHSAGTLPFAERDALLLRLARAHELLGNVPQASACYEELIAQAREAGALAAEWAALQRLLPLLNLSGRGDLRESIARVEVARRQAEERGDRALLAETEWSAAQLAFYNLDPPTSIAHAERALALARADERQELVARCLNSLLLASIMCGRSREGLAHGEEALALFVALGDRALEADTLSSLSTGNLYLGNVGAAVEAARQAVAISRAIANPWGEVWAAAHLARALLDSGDFGEAAEVAARSLTIAREQEHPLMIAFAAAAAGTTHRARFALDEAVAAHREALQADAQLATLPYLDAILGELVADHALLGDWATAHAYARDVLSIRRYTFYTYGGLVRWHEIDALLRGGDAEIAEAEIDRFAAALGDHRRHLIPLHRARAVLANWRGDADTALAQLAAADRLAAELGLPGERWPILAALAAHHRLRSNHAQAESQLTEARALIAHLATSLPAADRARFLAGALRTLTPTGG